MMEDDQPKERKIERRAAAVALVGAAAALVAAPREAKADLSMSEVRDAVTSAINATIDGDIATSAAENTAQRQILEAAFRTFRAVGLPAPFINLMRQIFALLGSAGEHSTTTTGTIPGAMEISWPEVAVLPSELQEEHYRAAALATRARVTEASMVCATIAEQQGVLSDEDMATLMLAEERAAEGDFLTPIVCIAKLVSTGNQRLAQMIHMLNQHTALHGDMTVRDQAGLWLGGQVVDGQRDYRPDLPGVQSVGSGVGNNF